MASEQIFFGNNQQSGDQQIGGASPYAFNVVIDGTNSVRRRPGLSAWSGFPTTIPEPSQIDGIASFAGDIYYVTANRKIFKVSGGAVTNMSTSGGSSFLAGLARPAFAETQFRLAIAGGDIPAKVDAGATTADVLGGSPPTSTQMIALSSRLFSNNTSSTVTQARINWSGVASAGNETWPQLNFTTAEARPDAIVALRENSNQCWAFKSTTLQVFSPDPQSVIATGQAINRGCAGAYSVVAQDESFAWLDERGNFVSSDGRGLNVLSDAIGGTLDAISVKSDCWGFRYDSDQLDFLFWKFPTDGRAFVTQTNAGWAQWSGYSDGNGHITWPGTAVYYAPALNLYLVGLATGQIARLDVAANTDLGAKIKAEVTTGFVNHGNDGVKFCDVLRFTFKRGTTISTTEPKVFVSWRNDLGAFCEPRQIGLGVTGDNIFTRELRTLGGYVARQWKIEFSDASDFVLSRCEEIFTMGSSN